MEKKPTTVELEDLVEVGRIAMSQFFVVTCYYNPVSQQRLVLKEAQLLRQDPSLANWLKKGCQKKH